MPRPKAKNWFEKLWHRNHNLKVLSDLELNLGILLEDVTGIDDADPYMPVEDMIIDAFKNRQAEREKAYDEGYKNGCVDTESFMNEQNAAMKIEKAKE